MQSDVSPSLGRKLAAEWQETGAIRVPQLLSPAELDACRDFYDWILANPSSLARRFHEGDADSYHNDVGQAEGHHPRAEALFEACPSIRNTVQALFGEDNQNIWFLGYEVFHKSGGAARSSAFHQDSTFVPHAGRHLVRLWIPFEPLKKDYCLEVVSHSHRGPLFNPNKIFFVDPDSPEASGVGPTTPMFDSENELRAMPPIPDYLSEPEKHDILSWDMDPGDAVAFHLASVHGNAPVDARHPERNTLILGFMGDDCVYKPLPVEGLAFFAGSQDAYAGLEEGDHYSLSSGGHFIGLQGTGPPPQRKKCGHALRSCVGIFPLVIGFARSSERLLLAAALALFAGCATAPVDQPKTYSEALNDTANTVLGRKATQFLEDHENLSGFYPLARGMDAMGLRLRLAERAERSIDMQYFLMKNDTAGAVLIKSLLKSADRGVRIRLLLDDIFTKTPDQVLVLLDQHENIEVRIFNPIARRGFWTLNFLTSFKDANRRMHNKSFTVDNQVSIVGGRNIADEYFQLNDSNVFEDFEVFAIGPITDEVSASFDRYWNHSHAVPIGILVNRQTDKQLQEVRAERSDELNELYENIYERAMTSSLLQDLFAERIPLLVADARVLSDSPDKLLNKISNKHMNLANNLREVLLSAESEVIIITPYYVPRNDGVQLLRNLVEDGLRVVIVTNSLASNNHVAVHGGYARYRKDVIQAGAEVYELRANAAQALGNSEDDPESVTLHTKLYIFDRRYLFVGSLNLDPRSVEINAEMGLLIDSKEISGVMAAAVEEKLEAATYRVVESEQGRLEWHATIDGESVVETTEPLTSGWLRFKAWFLKIAPESQL